MTGDTTRTPPEADIAAIEARLAQAYPSFNVAEGVVQMQADIRALLVVLARVTRLVECEWQDDVPLARLYTLREALGLTTDCPVDQEMWEADIARNRALLARVDEYNAAMLDYERRDGWYTLAEERAGATARHAEKRLWAAIAARAAYADRGGAPETREEEGEI